MIQFPESFRDLDFAPGLPMGYRGPVFSSPGHSRFLVHEIGMATLQEISGDGFQLCMLDFHWRKSIQLSIFRKPGLYSFFLSEGEALVTANSSHYRLRPYQYILVPEQTGPLVLEPRKGCNILVLITRFEPSFTEELSPAFSDWSSIFQAPTSKKQLPITAGPSLRDTLHGLLHANYEPTRLPFYYKMKLTEYLFQQLDQTSRSQDLVVTAMDWEIEAVNKVYGLILKDLLQHYKINELAAQVRMDRVRLQGIFRQVFGLSPYELLLQARLDKVKELMEQGMPMKEAAPLAGYAHTTSFINAFKKRYGYSPGSMFRKK